MNVICTIGKLDLIGFNIKFEQEQACHISFKSQSNVGIFIFASHTPSQFAATPR